MGTTGATVIAHSIGDRAYRLGEFTSYRDAEKMVDRLSDVGFPVERVRIVGAGLQTVERVTGRAATGQATLIGAGLGGWLGLVTGLVLALFVAGPAWPAVLVGGPLIGAAAGAVMGLLAHWATDGRRDFAGTTVLQAQRHAVEVDRSHAVEAVQALDRS